MCDHHGRGSSVTDPHGQEGGGQHEAQHEGGWPGALEEQGEHTVVNIHCTKEDFIVTELLTLYPYVSYVGRLT